MTVLKVVAMVAVVVMVDMVAVTVAPSAANLRSSVFQPFFKLFRKQHLKAGNGLLNEDRRR